MKILLVEDDFYSRKNLTEFLSGLGHDIKECENGQDALKILEKELFHLVLSDIKMPEMDGYDLLKNFNKLEMSERPIFVMITGHGDVKGAVEAMQNGAYDYLLKPVDVRELALIIERINEYIVLKQENKKLNTEFDQQVNIVTKEIKKELSDIKKAYAKEVGTAGIGIFSSSLKDVYKFADKLHKNPDIPVLIQGETGSGKELVARYIHYRKGDNANPFIDMNCAAISPNLFESELFGYEAGAFTGGNPKGQKGKLELSENGSIFLDEIGELPPEYQAKLLRVLQERKYFRVGGIKQKATNARFICATNINIQEAVSEGRLREDLFYRLNVGLIKVPPLRERKKEILPLAEMFLKQLRSNKKTEIKSFSPDAKERLENLQWPGNVRELKNTIERLALLFDDEEINAEHLDMLKSNLHMAKQKDDLPMVLSADNFAIPEDKLDLDKLNLEIVRKVLDKTKWNKSKSARYLGISRKILYTYIKHIETLGK